MRLYPHLGESKTIDDMEKARAALEETYKAAGYGTVFVDIPEQNVDDAIVRLRVTEGRLDRVRITGARYFANGQIRRRPPLCNATPCSNLPKLQQELGDINRRSRDRTVTPVLRAGRTPGTVDVELKVQDSLPAHGTVEVNDRYTADTSKTRVSVNLSYDESVPTIP